MNLQFLVLLPRLMGLSDEIVAIVKGQATPQQYKTVLLELHDLLKQIPQLQGFLLLMEPLLKIVQKVGYELFADPNEADRYGLSAEEIAQGKAVVELLGPILSDLHTELAAAAAAVTLEDVDKLTTKGN